MTGVIRFSEVCDAIAATTKRNQKIEILASYLREVDDAALEAVACFFTGRAFAQRDPRQLSIGASTIVTAAKNVWGFSDGDLSAAYRQHGDLGDALCRFAARPAQAGFFTETLSPASLRSRFAEIAAASGKSAGKRRRYLCERILAACSQPLEAKYVIKIMTGDLRIGLREGLIIDAVARAFDAPAAQIRAAVMATGDIGSVALAARAGALHGVRIAYGNPIGFMLASPLHYGSSYRELSRFDWALEDKYDGIRAQAHKDANGVRLFSRTMNDISGSYPEVLRALGAIPGTFIVDGELVASRHGKVLPFRFLQGRLQRKEPTEELLRDTPVTYIVFDVMAIGEEYLLEEPLSKRRLRLEALISQGVGIERAPHSVLDKTAALEGKFEDARARGHEGLLLKRLDSPYHAGRRGRWWLKLKRELSTLDVVVVGAEWGHGKRAKVLSDYTFAIRGNDGCLLTIGKAYSGLTDAEIAKLTQWLLEHQIGRQGHRLLVEPKLVLEIAFDIIAPSTLHESGFALRFPRIVRIRDDKPVSEIDSLDGVKAMYTKMLARENVER